MPYTIVWLSLLTITSVVRQDRPNVGFLGNVAIVWPIGFSMLFTYFVFSQVWVSKSQKDLMKWVKFLLIWNSAEILYGLFVAEGYWDWKGFVGNTLVLILPVVAFSTTHTILVQVLLNSYIRYALPLAPLLFWTITPGGFGYYLAPFTYLLLFFHVLTRRWKTVSLFITGLVLIAELDARSNIIKFSIPLVLLGFNFLWDFRKTFLLEWTRKVFFVTPILLFVLGISGVFNVFKLDGYIEGEYIQEKKNDKGEVVAINLKADTRTGLYIEVLQTADRYNSWIFGRSPARGNESQLFAQLSEITGKKERIANEAAILNIFTWTGIVGVFFYMMVFYRASYLAINQSKNSYAKLIGLYIAFRWVYAWVEDINNFSLNYFMLWVFIGLCYSQVFRGMTNQEVKWWVRGIFDKKYQYIVEKRREEIRA